MDKGAGEGGDAIAPYQKSGTGIGLSTLPSDLKIHLSNKTCGTMSWSYFLL